MDAGFNELMAWTPPPGQKNRHNRRKHRAQPKLATAEDNALPSRSKLP